MQAARAIEAFFHVDPRDDGVSEDDQVLAGVGGLLIVEAILHLRAIAGGEPLHIKLV